MKQWDTNGLCFNIYRKKRETKERKVSFFYIVDILKEGKNRTKKKSKNEWESASETNRYKLIMFQSIQNLCKNEGERDEWLVKQRVTNQSINQIYLPGKYYKN